MDGIHDLGGMHGFGPIEVEADEPVFHQEWEGRVAALLSLVLGAGVGNIDKFRHSIERMPPRRYLSSTYYERWLTAIETLLIEDGVSTAEEIETRLACLQTGVASAVEAPERPRSPRRGSRRAVSREPRFRPGQAVRTRDFHPGGHTRLPRYARGKIGVIGEIYPSFVFPDTNAHDRGEKPQHVYSVIFGGSELWGEDAEPGTRVSLDLFEDYLETADE